MRAFTPVALLLIVLSAACQRDAAEQPEQTADLLKVIPNIPFPPGAEPLTSEKGRDAAQLLIVSTIGPDSVASYYRTLFTAEPWRLINESTSAGVTSFYVEQDGPSLWVTVQQNGDSGSMVTIAGAEKSDTSGQAPKSRGATPGPAS